MLKYRWGICLCHTSHTKYTNQLLLDSALCPGSPTWTFGSRILVFTPQLHKICQDPSCDVGTTWHSMAHTRNRAAWPTQCWQRPLLHANPLPLQITPRRCLGEQKLACAETIMDRAPPVKGTASRGPAVSPSIDGAFMPTSHSWDYGPPPLGCKLPLLVLPLKNPVS